MYSILMSVYKNDNPKYLEESIQSMLNQTIVTNDFVIIKDGPLTDELNSIIEKYKTKYNFINVITLTKNVGLGNALNIGIKECKNELVARMDADDYSFNTRIEKQLNYLKEHPDIDLVGTQAFEFIYDVNNPIQYNNFPITNNEIIKYAHSRNPYAHPSVIFKKTKVLESGNYQQVFLCEDYDLWIRMIQNGCKCANLDEYLFAIRVGNDFYKRRSGLKYIKSINNLMIRNMNNGFFNKKDYVKNMLTRSIIYSMPNFMRRFIYSKFLRSGVNND